jgi:hypothetical protein
MSSVEDTLAMLEMQHRIEFLERERDEWRECVERLAYSAPITFSNDVTWLKALLLAEKTVKRYAASARVNRLLENNNTDL